ncbi:glutamate dehydrogenase [Flavobacterium psychrophilum]|uniref:Glutamate dehydrogenase n=1 Tax=Flavobacterium psychrophilum (strain ATCC 49511 / DSM 21280 / CIP 103535 / JIP02/86) TaxID=402612 RepID=A6GWB3_FLAPJ|nr:glutamate dehydrogenase [Flavobacterium psychrophilum]AIG29197.1 glutamate dehydrogenase [Flavobacterium psychrophilum]AIG31473.1 glutamate dehydrogenase [Flavobacterium psychrophilum]AIG33630.1 glutamate dehydrogenase [Flavobacterium psychrophilum]AIG35989.1 glutamate dehydrogenase [Flavobacterium psychrophilum]AIG38253.1 glutamate dehydrogenase [Flavobacterium psychrophilum]
MPRYFSLMVLFLLVSLNTARAQFGFSHEVGIIAGPVAFQSDYGQRHNFATNAGNTGIGIGLVHYLNFSYKAECNCYTPETYFNDHFKVRSELSYSKTKFNMFGEWVTPEKVNKPDPAPGVPNDAKQLKSMEGSTAVTDIGMQLEFYPFSIRDFAATNGAFAPFVSLGAHFSFYNPEVHSTLGKLNDVNINPKYWAPSEGEAHGFTNKNGTVWSVVSSIGTRYKLTPLSDLMLDLRAQYYFSNWVDGLNPNPAVYKENKANDWNLWLNFGYIYYLN